jgi:hypothetical protein
MSTTAPVGDSLIFDATHSFYDRWVAETAKIEYHPVPPAWADLTIEQMMLWTAAFAANVEVAHRMTTAILATVKLP